MNTVHPCTGCGGRSVLLQFDGVYYFVSCEQCEKAGPRGGSAEEALDLWNRDSSTMFLYGEDLRKSRILKRLACQDRRDDRVFLHIPVVLAVGGKRGRRVTGAIRNLSNYGAYLELTGGDMSAIPVDIEELRNTETHVFFKPPKDFVQSVGAQGVQTMLFSARHMYQRREVLGIGGCFVRLGSEQVKLLADLVSHAHDTLQAADNAR